MEDKTDEELREIRDSAIAEINRRIAVREARSKSDDLAIEYQKAIGREDGDPWVQPLGAHDAYFEGAITTHKDKVWVSEIPANIWEPGVTGWTEEVEEGGVPEWVQPLGNHDAYSEGDPAMHNGELWISDVDNNVWEPGVYGWSLG